MIGSLLGEVLAGLGHEVCSLERTQAGAVAAAARCRPDLMIVDVNLAAGNGVAAVAAVQRTKPVPHFFISGEEVPGASGAVVLLKPFCEAELVAAMQRTLGPR